MVGEMASLRAFQRLADRRRGLLVHSGASCRILGTWAVNGFSRIDSFDDATRPVEPYAYALVATEAGLGCCYADRELANPVDWVGVDAARVPRPADFEWEVALIDAMFDTEAPAPARVFEMEGTAAAKSGWRAELAADLVDEVLARAGKTGSVVMLGAVGAFIQAITRRGHRVCAGDIHPAVIGQKVGNVIVHSAAEIEREIRPESVVLLTGMAIANHSIDRIFTRVREAEAMLIVYGQTGGSFAGEYMHMGAEFVLAEVLPFYSMPGLSRIRLFDRKSGPG